MKTLFYTKTLIALAVAVAAAAAAVSQAQEQPIPPPSAESALPANIIPGTPLADVVKMVQAGVDASTIQSYIVNSQSAFNLDADKIITLNDIGVPSDLVNAMLDRDKALYASAVAPAPAPAPATTVVASEPAPEAPPAEVTVNYFYDTLSPYGTWVQVDGYGRCWRPTVVVYNSDWRPYCDRGHWVYTDCGWYWDSDYSWGVAFHYGRWFRDARFGWCWYPDTVWAPSWVAWRSGGDYCGWAPLPPFAEFRSGFGFYYHGASVAMDFDFGLNVDCFTFVSAGHFYDRHPRSYCVDRVRAPQIFRQTTIINNYVVNNQTIVNRGISVDRIRDVTHRNIEPVHVGSLPHAGRQGWRGDSPSHSMQPGNADSHGTRQLGNNAATRSGTIGSNLGHNDSVTGHDANSSAAGISSATRLHRGSGSGNIVVSGAANNNNSGTTRLYRGPASGNTVVNGSDAGHSGNSSTTTRGFSSSGNRSGSTSSSPMQNQSSGSVNNDARGFAWRHNEVTAQNTQVQPSTPAFGSTVPEHRQFRSDNNWQSSSSSVQPPAVTHQQPQNFVREQPQPPIRSANPNSFNSDRSGYASDWRPSRNVDSSASSGFSTHGAAQLEQRQFVQPSQPRMETHPSYGDPTPRSYSPPAASAGGAPYQSHNANSSNAGGGNNNGSSRNSDNNRQNQNH